MHIPSTCMYSRACPATLSVMAKKTTAKEPTFEQALEQLEGIIDRIESGEVGLEQCLTEYEQGMKLIAQCRKTLDTAEKRITELTTDDKGKLRTGDDADLDAQEDEA